MPDFTRPSCPCTEFGKESGCAGSIVFCFGAPARHQAASISASKEDRQYSCHRRRREQGRTAGCTIYRLRPGDKLYETEPDGLCSYVSCRPPIYKRFFLFNWMTLKKNCRWPTTFRRHILFGSSIIRKSHSRFSFRITFGARGFSPETKSI